MEYKWKDEINILFIIETKIYSLEAFIYLFWLTSWQDLWGSYEVFEDQLSKKWILKTKL